MLLFTTKINRLTAAIAVALTLGGGSAAVAQLPYLVGKQAVENVQLALAGKEVPANVDVPTMVLTQEILAAGTEPMLEFVK